MSGTKTIAEAIAGRADHAAVLVLGLGNPILGDDGLGWKVAESVAANLGALTSSADVECASVGGLGLMERMLGYDHVVLVDSIQTGLRPEGSISVFRLEDLPDPSYGHSTSAHDSSLATALQAARCLDADVPSRVEIVAVETQASLDFSEDLSPAVAAAIPMATRKVLDLIEAVAVAG